MRALVGFVSGPLRSADRPVRVARGRPIARGQPFVDGHQPSALP